MAEQKKFLDQEGLEYLWSKISMKDYPNNETLIAVLNAIDLTKADKDDIVLSDWKQNNENGLDHVKNRTHYTIVEDINIIDNWNGDLSNLTHVQLGNFDMYQYSTEVPEIAENATFYFSYNMNGETKIETPVIKRQEKYMYLLEHRSAICGIYIVYEDDVYIPNPIFGDGATLSKGVWIFLCFGAVYPIDVRQIGEYKKLDLKYMPYRTLDGNEVFNGLPFERVNGTTNHAEGDSWNFGNYSHSEGIGTVIVQDNYNWAGSHAEGFDTIAGSNDATHAEGLSTVAYGHSSHAEGQGSRGRKYQISGVGNSTTYTLSEPFHEDYVTEGVVGRALYCDEKKLIRLITGYDEENLTVTLSNTLSSSDFENLTVEFKSYGAFGKWTHSEGGHSAAIGDISHAEGQLTVANGAISHAEGNYTIANGYALHVQGKFNIPDNNSEYAHIVGNGDSLENRANAHTLDWEGNAWFSGDVYTGSTSGTNKDDGSKKLATEEYVDNKIKDVEVQPDWNQNDETALDYVKNRTHFVMGIEEVQYTKNRAPLFLMYPGCFIYVFPSSDNTVFNEGSLYKITLNDVEYLTIAQKDPKGYICLGDIKNSPNVIDTDNVDSLVWDGDYPFCYETGSSGRLIIQTPCESTYTLSISEIKEKIKSLDKKYIDYVVGEKTHGKTMIYDGKEVVGEYGAEIFNDANNLAVGEYSHAEGNRTKAIGSYSHAEGINSIAIGLVSHAEGDSTASGNYSSARGLKTIAFGNNSSSEGLYTKATGNYSHVLGKYNIEDEDAIVDKYMSSTILLTQTLKYPEDTIVYLCENFIADYNAGTYAPVNPIAVEFKDLNPGDTYIFNSDPTVEKYYEMRELKSTYVDESSGKTIYEQSYFIVSMTPASPIEGKYAHIVGNGTYEMSSNAHTLDWEGNAWYAGDVYVGSTSGTNKDEGSKKLATEEYVDNKAKQPDWNQSDETALDYIKNKPEVVLRNEIEETKAIELAIKTGLVSSIATQNDKIITDSQGRIYLL